MRVSKTLSTLLLGSVISLNASIVAKSDTWQMGGFGMDMNLSKSIPFSANDYKIMWFWEDGDWKAFAQDEQMREKIIDAGLFGDSIKANQGFWVYSTNDIKIPSFTSLVDSLPKEKGWHLLNFSKGLGDPSSILNRYAGTRSFFVYRDGEWSYKHKYSKDMLEGDLTNISSGEGFWLNNTNSVSLYSNEYSYYNDPYTLRINENYNEKNNDIFTNKKFDGAEFSVTLDQNGTVISDDERFNGGVWSGGTFYNSSYYYSQMSFKITKDNMEYFLYYYKYYNSYTYETELTLDMVEQREVELLDNGVKVVVSDMNHTYYGTSATLSDTTPDITIDTTVKNALNELETLLTTNTNDASSKLTEIKNSLIDVNSQDAQVALAIVNLVEILDEDIVKSLVNFNGGSYSMNSLFSSSLFPQNYEELLEFNEAISAYSENAKELLSTLATRLKDSSDLLDSIYSDSNYIFEYGDIKFNYVDAQLARGVMLALAFKLEFLSSYDYGEDDWFKPITEESITYVKASVDPASFINSKAPFSNPNQESLTLAKEYFSEFVNLYLDILNNPYHKQEGLNLSQDEITSIRNIKYYLKSLLNNLEGNSDSFTVIDEHMNYSYYPNYSMEIKKESFEVDINSLFDANKTVTIEDFPTYKYDKEIDTQRSKIENDAVDSNGEVVDLVEESAPTTINNINNIFKSFVDEDGEFFEGDSLINNIFN